MTLQLNNCRVLNYLIYIKGDYKIFHSSHFIIKKKMNSHLKITVILANESFFIYH